MILKSVIQNLFKNGFITLKSNSYYFVVTFRDTEISELINKIGTSMFVETKTFNIFFGDQKIEKKIIGFIFDVHKTPDHIKKILDSQLYKNSNLLMKELIQRINEDNFFSYINGIQKVYLALDYETITGKTITLRGEIEVIEVQFNNYKFYFEPQKLQEPPQYPKTRQQFSGIILPFDIAPDKVFRIKRTYKELRENIRNYYSPSSHTAFLNLLVNYILVYITKERKFVQMPTDLYSQKFMIFGWRQNKPKNKGAIVYLDEREKPSEQISILIGSKNKQIDPELIPVFLNSLSSRLGDVYALLLDYALYSGYSSNGQKIVEVSAKDIARFLSDKEKPSKRLIRNVAEALGDLVTLQIRIPVKFLSDTLKLKFKVSEKDEYFTFSPFFLLGGFSYDKISEPKTRIHRAQLMIHPFLWYLYTEFHFQIPIPLEVLKIDTQYPYEIWAKSLTCSMYAHARRNHQKNSVYRVKLMSLLEYTGIIKQIENYKAKNLHSRSVEYLIKTFKIMKDNFEIFELEPPTSRNLNSLLSSTVKFKIKEPKSEIISLF